MSGAPDVARIEAALALVATIDVEVSTWIRGSLERDDRMQDGRRRGGMKAGFARTAAAGLKWREDAEETARQIRAAKPKVSTARLASLIADRLGLGAPSLVTISGVIRQMERRAVNPLPLSTCNPARRTAKANSSVNLVAEASSCTLWSSGDLDC